MIQHAALLRPFQEAEVIATLPFVDPGAGEFSHRGPARGGRMEGAEERSLESMNPDVAFAVIASVGRRGGCLRLIESGGRVFRSLRGFFCRSACFTHP